MKKLLLTGIAALFLATGAAHAQAVPWGSPPVPPEERGCTTCRTKDDYKHFNCMRRYMLRRQRDPRARRVMQQGRQSQAQLRQNPDAVNFALEARRACGR